MVTINKFFILIIGIGFFISCSSDLPPANCASIDLSVDFETEQNAIAMAQINHLLDASNENCNILKDALNDYLTKLEKLENCERSPTEEDQYQLTINNLQSDLDSLTC